MKYVFLKDKFNNVETMKKLCFEVRYHYGIYSFDEKDFSMSKIRNPNAKIGKTYYWHDAKADEGRGGLSRALQHIVIHGENSYRMKGYVDLDHQCGSVSAVLPKFVEMVGKQYFEIRDLKACVDLGER